MNSTKKTALITGASSGIGYELAKLFAKDNYHLAIVGRDKNTLSEAASEFKKLGAKDVSIYVKDLSMEDAAKQLYDAIKNDNLEVNVLVNDAGVGQKGKFIDIPIEKDLEIIHLNIVSLVSLTKYFLKDMVARGEGRILQLASIASYQPTPLLSIYSASKAFVLSFTDSLREELKDTGVTITALIPGPTDTDFFNKADMENTKAAQNDPEDPAIVAKIGYEGLMNGEHHAVAPGMKKQIVQSTVMPNETVAKKAKKQMEEVKK